MKSNSKSFSSGTGVYGNSGKITKQQDIENEGIRVYLSKLKQLVPFMPKDRKLSKLEVIQYVIDYIYDLQLALETHPNLNSAAVHSAAAVMLSSQSQQPSSASSVATKSISTSPTINPVHRQPLSVLTPNANIQVATTTSSTATTSASSTCVINGLRSTTEASTSVPVISNRITTSQNCSTLSSLPRYHVEM